MWIQDINTSMEALRQRVGSDIGESAPIWQPDSSCIGCYLCSKKFTMLRRRHHCRYCGAVVCDSCSLRRHRIDHVDPDHDVRVCDKCFPALRIRQSTYQQSMDLSFEDREKYIFGESNSDKRPSSEAFSPSIYGSKSTSFTRVRDAGSAKVDITTLFDEAPPVTSYSKVDK